MLWDLARGFAWYVDDDSSDSEPEDEIPDTVNVNSNVDPPQYADSESDLEITPGESAHKNLTRDGRA